MHSQSLLTSFVALLALATSGCSWSARQPPNTIEVTESGILTVYVVNYPLKYFTERIGGEHVEVVFPAPVEEDPAFWTPDAETITAYQQADLILLNGAGYAAWTKIVSLPEMKLVDTSVAFSDRYIASEIAVSHSHGPSGEHAHADTAFTTWLDPQLAISQAEAIQRSLAQSRPRGAEEFRENFAALAADLNELDLELFSLTEGQPERHLIFSHPVYQYLQRRYGLNGKSVHWEPGEAPSPAMWEELQKMLEQHPAEWFVWESEPLEQSVEQLAEMGLQSIVYRPCGNQLEQGDFLEVMRDNLENLRCVFAQRSIRESVRENDARVE